MRPSVLILFSTTEAGLFWVPYPMPCESWSFPVFPVGRGHYSSPMWVLGILPPNSFEWFFLLPQVVSAHAWADLYSARYSRGPSAHFWSSFSVQYSSSLVLCPANSICFIFSESALPSVQFVGLHLGFLSCIKSGKLFQGSKLGDHNHRAHFIFLIFGFHCL